MQWLWVDETLRGQHMAGQMLEAAEDEASDARLPWRLDRHIQPDGAPRPTSGRAMLPFGQLEDFPNGRTRIFLQKKLR